MSSSVQSTTTYQKIVEFVKDLNSAFGVHQHSLQLYNRWLETKVNSLNEQSVHVELFNKFIEENKEAITQRNYDILVKPTFVYNKKCEIKFAEIFREADPDTRNVIWNHFLTIRTSLNPTPEAVELLNSAVNGSPSTS